MKKQDRIEFFKQEFMSCAHIDYLRRHYPSLGEVGGFEALEGGEDNINLLLRASDGKPCVVARHYLISSHKKINDEMNFLNFLANHDFPTPPPLATSSGSLFLQRGEEPCIALFPFVEGRHDSEWTGEQRAKAASLLAGMHALCSRNGYRMGEQKERLAFLSQGHMAISRSGLKDKDAFLNDVMRFIGPEERIGRALLAKLPSGPIHHDLNAGNVFWEANGEVKALIDFDEAHDAPYLFDLVMAIHYLALDEERRIIPDACRDLIKGYSKVRPLSAEELGALQYCWDLENMVGAMEFILDNADYLKSALECRTYERIYKRNLHGIDDLFAG